MILENMTDHPYILIEGAMDTETEYLIEKMESRTDTRIGNWTFHSGMLGAKQQPVVLVKTYQGIVNAAAATSLAFANFKVKAVINQGIAGGHRRDLHRGDLVLGEKVVPMGAAAYAYSAEGAGIDAAAFEPLAIEILNRRTGKTQKVTEFPCDEKLLAAAGLVQTECNVQRGVIGSADEWNNQLDRIALLRERYGTAAEDMESLAPAQLSLSFGIPFIGIRIISNSIVNGEAFDESVGLSCQRFILKYMDLLASIL